MQHHRRNWIVVAAMALLVRGAVAFAALAPVGPLAGLEEDPDAYRRIAETLATSGVFGVHSPPADVDATAFRPPLYPWLLSWMVSGGRLAPAAVAGMHWVLGVLTILGTYAVVGRCFGRNASGQSAAMIAAGLVAIDPLLVLQSTRVMTETLATAIAVGVWWAVTRAAYPELDVAEHQRAEPGGSAGRRGRFWAAAGLLLALGFLCRPVFVVWTALLALWLVIRAPRNQVWRRPSRNAVVLVVLPTVVAIAAWTTRNAQVIGRPVWATTHGGYTLLLGNNPEFYHFLDQHSFGQSALWGDAWDAEPFHVEWARRQREIGERLSSGEFAMAVDREVLEDEAAGEWAKQVIAERPEMFLYSSAVRWVRLWSPVPRIAGAAGGPGAAIGVYYVAVYLAAFVALVRYRRRLLTAPWISAALLAIALSVVHSVYWSNIRMRAPAVPMLVALAAASIVRGDKGNNP